MPNQHPQTLVNSSSDINALYTLSNIPDTSGNNLSLVEMEIFKNIIQGTPHELSGVGTPTILDDVKSNIVTYSDLNDSNVVLIAEHVAGTPVNHPNSSYSEIQGTGKSQLVSLGNDNSPTYTGNIVVEYSSGDNLLTSSEHTVTFDPTHSECNLFKAMNSTAMNLDTNATSGLKLSFQNGFNSQNAFFTTNTIVRSVNNILGNSGISLGVDGITSALTTSILDSTTDNLPTFGSHKFVQDAITIDVVKNLSLNSTLKLFKNSNSSVEPVKETYTETEFYDLFSPLDQIKVGKDYKLEIQIGDTQTANGLGGYNINSSLNTFYDTIYDSNNVASVDTLGISLLSIDDTNILGNLPYMNAANDNSLFNKHAVVVKNGSFSKDSSQSNIVTYNDFTISTGLEKLTVVNANDVLDLTKGGSVEFASTNNILGDSSARFTEVSHSTRHSINKLVVSYADTEADFILDAGVVNEFIRETSFIESTITTKLKSTIVADAMWNGPDDIRLVDDVALVFQDTPKSDFYDATNIKEFSGVGVNSFIGDGFFGLFSLRRRVVMGEQSEYDAFLQASDNTIISARTSATLTQINLANIGAAALGVGIYNKSLIDLATLSNSWGWNSGDSTNGTLQISNNAPVSGVTTNNPINGNGEFLLQYISGGADELLEDNVYSIMGAPVSSLLNIVINWKTQNLPVTNKDSLFNYASITCSMPNIIQPFTKISDKSNIKLSPIIDSETITTTLRTISNLTAYRTQTGEYIPTTHKVYEYLKVEKYRVSIKVPLASFQNIWATSSVITQYTVYHEVFNTRKNSIMPDHSLKNICDLSGNQIFKAYRYFNSLNNHQVSTVANFTPEQLRGFTAHFRYKVSVDVCGNDVWENFHTTNIHNRSIDLFYDQAYEVNFGLTSGNNIGTMILNIDIEMGTKLGLFSHRQIQNGLPSNLFYNINISPSTSEDLFAIDCYKYTKNDLQYFSDAWSPYSNVDNLFPKNSSNVRVGIPVTNMNTLIEYITEGNEELIQFTVTDTNTGNLIFTLKSTKDILELYNVIAIKESFHKHTFRYGNISPYTTVTEYIQAKRITSTPGKSYVKLPYASSTPSGVYAIIDSNSHVGDNSVYTLNNDIVKINLHTGASVTNAYGGRYSAFERIITTSSGKPAGTNSTKHRNVILKYLRGYVASSLLLNRTATTAKFVCSDSLNTSNKIVSSLDSNNDGTALLWNGRVNLIANVLKLGQFTNAQVEDMSLGGTYGSTLNTILGNIGLKFGSNLSMMTADTNIVTIPIQVNPATTSMRITNPLEATLNENVTSNVTTPFIKNFYNCSFIADRIKNYQVENYQFTISVPDMKIYLSERYVGDVKTFTDWTLHRTVSDTDLRTGIIDGVVNYKRNQIAVKQFVKYCLCPRPIALLTAYRYTSLGSNVLPYNFTTTAIVPQVYGFDIDISDPITKAQGILPSLQNHKPFNTNPATNVPNPANSVPDGFNNVTVGIKCSKYLNLRTPQSLVSFNVISNRIKLLSHVGVSPSTLYPTTLYDGLIQDITNLAGWASDSYDLEKIVSIALVNKKLDIKFRQPISPIANFLPVIDLTNPNINLLGITFFGTGRYILDLITQDSTKVKLYTADYKLTEQNEVQLKLHRFSTASATTWEAATGLDAYNKSYKFKPNLLSEDTTIVTLNLPDNIGSTPFNLDDLIKTGMETAVFDTWTENNDFTSIPSPISFTTLSQKGNALLHNILWTGQEIPFKIYSSYRPLIMEIRNAHGGLLFGITNDGKLLVPKVNAYELNLLPSISGNNGLIAHLESEVFVDNIVVSQDDT